MKKSAKTKSTKVVAASTSSKSAFSPGFVYVAMGLLLACLVVVLYQDRQIRLTVDAINAELKAQQRAQIGK